MKNIKYVFLFLGVFAISVLSAQTSKYTGHFVAQGETINKIAERYGVSASAIKSLNPDVDTANLRAGVLLIIPPPARPVPEKMPLQATDHKGLTHRVKPSETLYHIAKTYGTSPEEIESMNPGIDIRRLSIGQEIKIPTKEDVKETKNQIPASEEHNANEILTQDLLKNENIRLPQDVLNAIHFVEPKETFWSVARQNNMKPKLLYALNPQLNKKIKPGDILFLTPNSKELLLKSVNDARSKKYKLYADEPSLTEKKPDEAGYIFYSVYSKETIFNISKKFGVSVEQIYKLNPGLQEKGLKSNTIIKIPTDKESVVYKMLPDKALVRFDSLPFSDKKALNVALILPLKLSEIAALPPGAERRAALKKAVSNPPVSYAVDFYTGVLSALDSLQKRGAKIKLKVLDNYNDSSKIIRLIAEKAFDNIDLVIGPFFASSFNALSEHLESRQIPIVSPLVYKDIIPRSNTIVSVVPPDLLHERALSYIDKKYANAKLFLVAETADSNDKETYLKDHFGKIERLPISNEKEALDLNSVSMSLSYKWIPQNPDSLYKKYNTNNKFKIDYSERIKERSAPMPPPGSKIDYSDKQNVVFVELKRAPSILGAISVLNRFLSDSCKVVMTTLDHHSGYDEDDISNTYLSNLNFSYASVNKPLTDFSNPYAVKYRKAFGAYPNKYVTRGFDLTFDLIARLYRDGDLLNTLDQYRTEGIENTFDYSKYPEGGFYNVGSYLIEYENMYIKEVEIE